MDCCLAHSLQRVTIRAPDAIAVMHDGAPNGTWTFLRLWRLVEILSNCIFRSLTGFLGDETTTRLGILIAPSAEYVAAVAAASKVGAAFVPLDPSWPLARIVAVVQDAGCSMVVGSYHEGWSPQGYQRTLEEVCRVTGCLEVQVEECSEWESPETQWSCSEIPFSYIMYTSGSTGKPKGVCGTQRGLLNRLRWMEQAYPYLPSERGCFKTSISFIDHLTESFGPLLAGIPLVVPRDTRENPLYLAEVLERYKITRLTAVPSLLQAIFPALTSVQTLRVLVSSGEPLPVPLLTKLRQLMPQTKLLNLYGSTEVSGDCTYFDCDEFSEQMKCVPIGKVIPENIAFLDVEEPSALKGTSELCIGGVGVALGYWKDASNGAFAEVEGHGRVFKTGDLVRRLESGVLVLVGRKDRVLKVRGHRIEPQEVELRLEEHSRVQRAAVVSVTSSNDVQLVGYVKAVDSVEESFEGSLKKWLSLELPTYMVPDRIVFLAKMPMTESGKVDYTALKNEEMSTIITGNTHQDSSSTSGSLQNVMQVFSQVLRVESVYPSDDFFLLGGTSISAAHAAFKLGIDMRLLFTYRTAAELNRAMNLQPGEVKHLEQDKPTRKASVSRDEPAKCKCGMRKRQKTSPGSADPVSGWPHGLGFETSAFSRGLHTSSPQLRRISKDRFFIRSSWNYCLHACVDASPLVVMTSTYHRLYIGSHANKFFCLDAISGELQWETSMQDRVESTAAITRDFNQVVVGCYDGNIYFMDSNDGSIRWKFQTDGELKCQPLVDAWAGLVWCGSHDHSLYVLDPISQNCVWRYACGGSVFASPVADDVSKHVYVATTNGTLMRIDTTPSFHVAWKYTSRAPIFGGPAFISSSSCVIFGTVDGCVSAVSSAGSLLWKEKTGGPIFSSVCSPGAFTFNQAIVTSKDGTVQSYMPDSGNLLWKHCIGEPIVAGVGVDNVLELLDEENNTYRLICVCGTSGTMYVMRVPSGASGESHAVASFKLPGELFSAPLVIGGRIFVGCRDDNVHCLDISGL